jgi:pimeloyl-ACP methyl ester carboxylesterase
MKDLTFLLLLLSAGAVEHKTCLAPDGVRIAYSAAGTGKTTLLFIHGGFTDRSFFNRQLNVLADRYRVIAVDLAGHGQSGSNRTSWSLPQFGKDAAAVIEAEDARRVIVFGNSLGGPVAVETALLLPDRVVGVVGIDTFQDLGQIESPEQARKASEEMRERAESFRADHAGSMRAMIKALFHPDADPALVADVERRMARTSRDVVSATLAGLQGYDVNASARKLAVPLRAINGDLYPTDVAAARKVKEDFDAIVMKHMGHYPMLERPEEFERHVVSVVEDIEMRRRP